MSKPRMLDPFDKNLHTYFRDTKRIKDARHRNFIQSVLEEQRRDNIIENVFIQSTAANPYYEMVEENTKLCQEVKEEKRQRFLEEKRRQQLRENNQELKELERKLRGAYISQTLAAQTADQEAARNREKAYQLRENEQLEKARLKQKEYEKLRDEQEHQKKEALKHDLQEQIMQMCDARKKNYEEFLHEKKAIDDIIRKIQQENLDSMKSKLEKKAQVYAEMNDFMLARREWELMQQKKTDAEDIEIEKIIRQREEEKKTKEEEKKRIHRERDMLSEKIGHAVYCVEKEKQKRNELLQDLLVQERKAKDDSKYREELENQLRQRIQVRLELDNHMANIHKQKDEEKEEDRRYREEILRQLAERDKLDQLSDEKRRRKVMEHRKALQHSLDEKKRIKAKEMTALLKKRQEQLNEEERKQKLVEEERIRMLQEHATKLIGFLPPGVLREEDRKFLNLPPANAV